MHIRNETMIFLIFFICLCHEPHLATGLPPIVLNFSALGPARQVEQGIEFQALG